MYKSHKFSGVQFPLCTSHCFITNYLKINPLFKKWSFIIYFRWVRNPSTLSWMSLAQSVLQSEPKSKPECSHLKAPQGKVHFQATYMAAGRAQVLNGHWLQMSISYHINLFIGQFTSQKLASLIASQWNMKKRHAIWRPPTQQLHLGSDIPLLLLYYIL